MLRILAVEVPVSYCRMLLHWHFLKWGLPLLLFSPLFSDPPLQLSPKTSTSMIYVILMCTRIVWFLSGAATRMQSASTSTWAYLREDKPLKIASIRQRQVVLREPPAARKLVRLEMEISWLSNEVTWGVDTKRKGKWSRSWTITRLIVKPENSMGR